ncbi:hypothetical protein GCM10009844_13790 [Nocardioides koreensis]|uniref:Uncharacterized protein n=1 Tax=Nocardioides koreensis TaxID=433651 RepID=A0ABP5LB57_9ACTN
MRRDEAGRRLPDAGARLQAPGAEHVDPLLPAGVVSSESRGTTYTPSITTYGAVKATSASRAGSTARKQRSDRPAAIAS